MNFNTLSFDKKSKRKLIRYSDWATRWMTKELRFNNSKDKRILSPSEMSQRPLCPPLPFCSMGTGVSVARNKTATAS